MSDLLVNLIIHTSFPLNISFPKLILSPTQPSWTTLKSEKRELLLNLLIASLKCLKTWCECLSELKSNDGDTTSDEATKLVVETVRRIMDGTEATSSLDTFNVRFALDIGPRYLPSKDVLTNLKDNSNEETIKTLAHDALTLFTEVFENKSVSQDAQDQFGKSNDLGNESN